MRNPFRRPDPPPPPEPAVIATRAFPIAINLADQEKIDHARYRLDRIFAYVEQTAAIAEAKMEEFRNEALIHAVNLRHAGAMADADVRAVLDKLGINI
jgi:hypothetical protein